MQLTKGIDFHRLFESVPGLYLILLPDLTIVAVSDAYLKATMTKREEILGRGLFEVFPDNPDDPAATGVSNLRASLNYVLQHATPHSMAVQKYDIRRPDGNFEERFWSPLNKPVFTDKKKLAYIIHRVEDVTEFMRMKKEEAHRQKLTEELQGKVQKMEMEIYNRAQEIQQVNTRLLLEIQERQKAEESIDAGRKMFSTIFYQSPVMNTIADAGTGRYIDVNDNFASFCGFKKEDIIGKTSIELNLRINPAHRSAILNTLNEKGFARDVLTEVQPGNGPAKLVSTSAHAVNINGRNCFLTAMIDVTERTKAEEKFRSLLESAPDAMIIANQEGKVVLVNQQTGIMFGYTKEEILNQPVEILIPAEISRKHETHRAAYYKEPKVRSVGAGLELYAVRKDGTQFPVEVSLSPLETPEGILVSAAIRDITERKLNESLIQKQKQEIQDFIDSMTTLCAKVATDGRLLIANKTAMHASGFSMEDLLKTNFLEGPWWSYNATVHARVKAAFQTACSGTPVNYDETIFVFGQVLPINFSLIPIMKPGGSVDYIVAEGRDISSLKSTQAALQTQTEELEKANKELEAFSYSVSHDLRSPLRIIDGYSELIVSDYSSSLDQEGNRLLGIIKANVRKMGRLIDDLLNLSRLGRKELIFQQVDMNKMVETVVTELLSGKTKEYNIETSVLEPADCDSNLIRQVWVNLISNAIKYSGPKDKPSIEISSAKSGNEIVYRIKDNGVGFNMEYADKLFGVFQRLHKMTEFEGTGVGLALAHRIVTRHGGRVWAEAEVNKGATFYFSLPLHSTNHQKNQ